MIKCHWTELIFFLSMSHRNNTYHMIIRSYRGWVHRYTRNLKKVRENGIVQRNAGGGRESKTPAHTRMTTFVSYFAINSRATNSKIYTLLDICINILGETSVQRCTHTQEGLCDMWTSFALHEIFTTILHHCQR